MRVMLNICRVQHIRKRVICYATVWTRGFNGISFDHPQQGCQYLVHALAVAYIGMHLTPHKQYVEHHVLGGGLPEVHVVWHASFDVLEDFGAEIFVGSKTYPWGLSTLSTGQHWTCSDRRSHVEG